MTADTPPTTLRLRGHIGAEGGRRVPTRPRTAGFARRGAVSLSGLSVPLPGERASAPRAGACRGNGMRTGPRGTGGRPHRIAARKYPDNARPNRPPDPWTERHRRRRRTPATPPGEGLGPACEDTVRPGRKVTRCSSRTVHGFPSGAHTEVTASAPRKVSIGCRSACAPHRRRTGRCRAR
ncbi:hypothetical protein STXM2123_5521 [Streptomyces sp. F-3]|nr:hypothetical protein STXM2123_5521 [Streptomyces sp. F-3]